MRERASGNVSKVLMAALMGVASVACEGDAAPRGPEQAPRAMIRGRVKDLEGAPLADLELAVDELRVRTDARGRFEALARADRELQVSVNSDLYSSARLPVLVGENSGANLELAVKSRRVVRLADAAAGGRVEGDDGFALALPSDALRDASGAPVAGEVEVSYAMINRPREIAAAPGRMQALDRRGIEGYGVADVRFYKNGARLKLGREMEVEVPLYEGHALSEGQEVDFYQMTAGDARWVRGARALVRANKMVVRASEDEWLSAATELPAASCMKGKLTVTGAARVANTTLRAARSRGLSLIQAETGDDGSFCLPVTPDDDWQVSTFFDDGQTSFGLEVELRSDNAAGMCGGSGCKDLGEVSLPALP